jgi:general secretion pathway protein I
MRARRAGGFTLLEILVAFIVLAVLGGAMLQLFQGSLRNVALAAEYSDAALLARAKLAEFESRAGLLPGSEEGVFDTGYRWHAELQPHLEDETEPAPDAVLQALRLDLVISWGEADDQRSYAVQTLLLTPRAAGWPEP